MIEWIANIAGFTFIGAGCFFMFTAILGCFRFKDFFQRLHAASISDSLGLPCIIVGLALHMGWQAATLKLLLILAFWFIASPTSCHLLAKGAALLVKPAHYNHPPERKKSG